LSRVGASVDPRPVQLPLPGGRDDATVALHPLLSAEQLVPPALFDRPAGRLRLLRSLARRSDRVWIPIPAFLVLHPGAGPVLIDTGFHPSVASDPTENLGPVLGRLSPIRMETEQAVSRRLADHHLRPQDITTVVMTHLHNDHASAVVEFGDSTFVVDVREWRAGHHGGARQGYRARHFDHAFDWRTVDFDADQIGSFASFGRAVDLFGDGSVRLLSTPGHSAGHLSVLLRLAQREVLLCGDAIYTLESLTRDWRPLVCADVHLYRRSRDEIRRFAEQTPTALVLPGHDATVWAELDPVYV
jgi:N-acyl homoserine lactone hydrolase